MDGGSHGSSKPSFVTSTSLEGSSCADLIQKPQVGTPYEGGVFSFDSSFPIDYPFHPPQLVFATPIMHPNIINGRVSIDVLRDGWSPIWSISASLLPISFYLILPFHLIFCVPLSSLTCFTLPKVLVSIVSLFECPALDAPAVERVREYLQNPDSYNERAKSWTMKYAL